jgi:hypothetical protein
MKALPGENPSTLAIQEPTIPFSEAHIGR